MQENVAAKQAIGVIAYMGKGTIMTSAKYTKTWQIWYKYANCLLWGFTHLEASLEEYLGDVGEEYLGEIVGEECLGQVQGERLARDMLDHAYHDRCYKSKSRDDLAGSMSEKMNPNDV